MNSTPKISIIVPVYNVEKYLRRCLDSIVAQTFTDWECICVDDGSPDGSGKILDEYAAKDKRFVIIHKENGGVSSARNAGLDIARGEYVTFCDSDDWIEKECFEKVVFLCSKDVDIIKSGYKIVGEKLNEMVLPLDYTSEQQISCVHTSCHFIYKKYLQQHKIYFPEKITLGEDWYFNYQLSLYSPKIVYLNEVTYNYYQNETSVMHSLSRKNISDEISVIKMAENRFPQNAELILLRKFDVKSKILHIIQDLDLYRNTFSECKIELFKNASLKGKIVMILIILHLDFLVHFMLKIKNKTK